MIPDIKLNSIVFIITIHFENKLSYASYNKADKLNLCHASKMYYCNEVKELHCFPSNSSERRIYSVNLNSNEGESITTCSICFTHFTAGI